MPARRVSYSGELWPSARSLPDGCGRYLDRHPRRHRQPVGRAVRADFDSAGSYFSAGERGAAGDYGDAPSRRCAAFCRGVAAPRQVAAGDGPVHRPALGALRQICRRNLSSHPGGGGTGMARVGGIERRTGPAASAPGRAGRHGSRRAGIDPKSAGRCRLVSHGRARRRHAPRAIRGHGRRPARGHASRQAADRAV